MLRRTMPCGSVFGQGRATEPMGPRDHRRRDEQREDGRGRDLSAWLPAFAVLPLVFLAFLGAAHLLHRDALRPAVGDIVVFPPGAPDREMFRVLVPVWRVDPAEGVVPHCLLNSSAMAAGGGSLMVERRQGTDPVRFTLHWAGARTDEGARDCGASATVEITRVELRKLATAAGGFGLGRRTWFQ